MHWVHLLRQLLRTLCVLWMYQVRMAIKRPSAEREDRSSNASSSRLSVSQPTVVVGEHRARAEQDRKKVRARRNQETLEEHDSGLRQ